MNIYIYENFISESKEFTNLLKNSRHSFKDMFKNFNIEDYEYIYSYAKCIVKNIKDSENIEVDENAYLHISACILAILFEEDKESYKHLFEDLRLRGIYKILKPSVLILEEAIEHKELSEDLIEKLCLYINDNNIDISDENIDIDIEDALNISNDNTTKDIKKYSDYLKDFDIINEYK